MQIADRGIVFGLSEDRTGEDGGKNDGCGVVVRFCVLLCEEYLCGIVMVVLSRV